LLQRIAIELGIAARPARLGAGGLARSGGGDARGDLGAALGGRGQREIGCES
jgi:hypothetical protein